MSLQVNRPLARTLPFVANPSVFGEIPGYPEGTVFDARESLRAAGLHRHGQAGISGPVEDGADAFIVSGGYPDDRDQGDRITANWSWWRRRRQAQARAAHERAGGQAPP
ncbi:YDG/SRA domain-containing protein [Geodermatophilus obscurus]|uniref:YDG/SRA domain-containing protein n=1 Tax=Geodermatophilus obscurus TaxID=1861 RepID=UPI000944E7D4|nr:YDG/SRA domain-containing protein [Geodermatophilus obscurus]